MARPHLNDDERAQRSAELVGAARQLFAVDRELPSVAAIAQAARVAKGSVYLSFGSKEEIFVALLEDRFAALLSGIVPVIATLPADPDAAADRFAAAYVRVVASLPDLMPLAAMTNSVLEKKLPLPAMIAFKQRLATGLQEAGAALARSVPTIAQARAVDLLLRSWSLTLGLWQTLDYPPELRSHLKRQSLSVFDREFAHELDQSIRLLWKGSSLSAGS